MLFKQVEVNKNEPKQLVWFVSERKKEVTRTKIRYSNEE
jgi:hypothetical protein